MCFRKISNKLVMVFWHRKRNFTKANNRPCERNKQKWRDGEVWPLLAPGLMEFRNRCFSIQIAHLINLRFSALFEHMHTRQMNERKLMLQLNKQIKFLVRMIVFVYFSSVAHFLLESNINTK